jgi:phage/plasmid-like protein (TIGR03299 family)
VSHIAVRRTTDQKVLGVVGPRYTVLQNRDAFRWFEPFLEAGEASLETAGSLRGGSRVWALAKLCRDPLEIVPGDEVQKYLLLSHSHDGSLAVRCGFTPVRVVCSNTLAMAHGADASKLIRIRHTGDVLGNLMAVREVMDVADQEFRATGEQYKRLARTSINQADLRQYVRRVLRIEEEADPSTRMSNIVEQVVGLAEAGRGNDRPSVRGTLWGGYNAVTEYLGYNRGRTQDNRLNSLWFGDSAGLNRHALDVALDLTA